MPELVARCRADAVDAVLLVPNCPVCHQSVSLAARALERAGIATVVMGCAKDIVEHVGVPRLLFSDFPLGNAAGRPARRRVAGRSRWNWRCSCWSRRRRRARTVQSPLRWSDNPDWKLDYCNIERLSPQEISAARRVRRRQGAGGEGARQPPALNVWARIAAR